VLIGKILVSLGSVLAEAQSDNLVARNVVREQSRSKGRRKHIAKRLKTRLEVGRDIPTVEGILDAPSPRWRVFLLTAAMTGMRVSELRGLHWANVDLAHGLVHVRERADKNAALGKPKSKASAPVDLDWSPRCPRVAGMEAKERRQ